MPIRGPTSLPIDKQPAVWTDPRGNPTLTNGMNQSAWSPDPAHMPNLSYVPYLMTAARWNLDRLNAQAAFALSYDWPGNRCIPNTSNCLGLNDIVVNGLDQVREQAWNIREIEEAAFIGMPGTFEQAYYSQVASDNWTYIDSQALGQGFLAQSVQGQAAGWLPSSDQSIENYQAAPWEEDYMTGVAVLAAEMGDAGARQYVNWQKDTWLAGRFNVPETLDMNPYDGVAYRFLTTDAAGNDLQTWSAIEAATVAAGLSNGTSWTTAAAGDYGALGRAVLGGALTLFPTDTNLQQALSWLNNSGSSYISPAYFQNDPTFNVVPRQ